MLILKINYQIKHIVIPLWGEGKSRYRRLKMKDSDRYHIFKWFIYIFLIGHINEEEKRID